MSERMIELHRARLLAAGNAAGSGVTQQHQNGSHPSIVAVAPSIPQTPQERAITTMRNEDLQLKSFLQRLQHERDDSQPGEASIGPTVPTALSRRMLHRQGAGYYDGTVAAITSAAADRFLATVLQQAVACRDQRLKGAELARQSTLKRKRHKRQYQEDVDDRRRRKAEHATYREEVNLTAIAAADALQQKPTGSNRSGISDTNKKDDAGIAAAAANPAKSRKKKKADAPALNGYKKRPTDLSDDEASYDSIDEEEEYYEKHYNDDGDDNEDDDDDDEEEEEDADEVDEDETMILSDIIRPLEAWDYNMSGKLEFQGSATHQYDDETNNEEIPSDHNVENDDDNDDIIDDGYVEAMSTDVITENGFSNDGTANKPAAATAAAKRSPSKSPDDKKTTAARKSVDSQPPPNEER
jgi:hypothetical protein